MSIVLAQVLNFLISKGGNLMAFKINAKILLINAFEKLALRIPIEDITVKNILDESGVSRSTFYREFNDKYALMNWYYQNHIMRLLSCNTHECSWKKIQFEIICFYLNNREYFLNITKYDGQNSFQDFIYSYGVTLIIDIIKKNTGLEELSDEVKFAVKMYNAGGFYMMLELVRGKISLSAEEFNEQRYRHMPEILKPLLR